MIVLRFPGRFLRFIVAGVRQEHEDTFGRENYRNRVKIAKIQATISPAALLSKQLRC